jgi:hypothetical protein
MRKSTDVLAEILLPYADTVSVARYDTNRNYWQSKQFPSRVKGAKKSEWYWVTRNESAAGNDSAIIRQLKDPKFDASLREVLQFIKRRSKLELDINELARQHERKTKVYKKFKDFVKLSELEADTDGKFPRGFNTIVQVVSMGEIKKKDDGIEERTVVVGDSTGMMQMRAQGPKEVPLLEVNETYEIRNARISLVNGTMTLSIGQWGLLTLHGGEYDIAANQDRDISSERIYTDKKGRPRDEL